MRAPVTTRRGRASDVGSSPPDAGPSPQEHELLLLLWIVEHVNATAAAMGYSANNSSGGQPIFLTNVIDRARRQLGRGKPTWARTSLLEAFEAASLIPEPDPTLIDNQCSWLSEVVRRGYDGSQRGHSRILPEVRRMTVPWRGLEDAAPADASHPEPRQALRRVALVDEALDPIAVSFDYLRSVLMVRDTLIEHEFQRFLRRCFGLGYRRHYVLLANLCARLNRLYYDRASFSVHVAHDSRAPIVATSALLYIIRDELRGSLERLDPSRRAEVVPNERACALGFFLAFRFCQLTRVQCQLEGEEEPERPRDPVELERDPVMRSGVSLLQPLEYSLLRSRIFGSLSGIEGLNEIFGGGLLPGVELGRVWVVAGHAGGGKTSLALHLSADMAARQHLVIYFSFEESYRNIGDRAVMFRLYQADRFQVDAAADDLEERIASAYDDDAQRGLLLYYRETQYDLSKALEMIRQVVERRAPRWLRSTAIIIDSVDALEHGSASGDEGETRYGRRVMLRQLFRQIEEANYWALVLTERNNPELPTLQHLADTYIEVGAEEWPSGRWLQIHKCRLQDFHPGKHGYQLRDGKGVSLVPNLASIQRAVRRRVPATLSESRVIPLPEVLWSGLPVPALQEKSSTLIWGNRRSGKAFFWLHMLTENARRVPAADRTQLRNVDRLRGELPAWPKEPLGAFMVVSFRTPPQRFRQGLRQRKLLQTRWNQCRNPRLRWYQPGPELTAAQVIRDLRRSIAEARIEGIPIERIVFDEIDAIDALLPNIARESAFWPSVFGLLTAEAMTVTYVLSSEVDQEPSFSEKFVASIDYALKFWRTPTPPESQPNLPLESAHLRMYKYPGPQSQLSDRPIPFTVTEEGVISLLSKPEP